MVVRGYSLKRVFVDREGEMSILKTLFAKVQSGIGQIVFINGEHGIGKTKLIEEFKKFVKAENAQFYGSRCNRTVAHEPYQTFIEALNLKLKMSGNGIYQKNNPNPEQDEVLTIDIDDTNPDDTNPDDTNPDVIYDVDTLIHAKSLGLIPIAEASEQDNSAFGGEITPPVPGNPVAEPLPMGLIPAASRITEVGDIKKQRTYLFEVMTNHLFKLASNSPVVLFIDDFQWTSLASLGYLEYLSQQIINKPVLLIFTLSTDELNNINKKNQEIKELIQNFSNSGFFTEITLKRFNMEIVSKMIKKTFSREDVPESFINQIYEKTEGNPLFIEDVISALIEEDVIDASSYVWQTRLDVSQIRMPGTTREVLIARLGRLEKNNLKVLGYAAVIGREFTYELVEKLTEMDEEKLLDAIDTMLDAKLIYEDLSSEVDKYRFDNPLIQDIAYNELSRSRRRFLHTKIGTILEQQNPKDIGKVVFDLANHFSKGRNYEKALKYLISAGDRATQIYAIDDARRYYLTALEMLNKFDYSVQIQQSEIELLSNLGSTCKMLGDWDQSWEYYINIPKLIEILRNKLSDKSINQNIRDELASSNWIQSKLADTYRNLAEIMRNKSDWVKAEKNYKISLLLSQEIDDYHGIAQAERGRGDIDWRKGDYQNALEHYDICIDFATKINDLPVISVTYIDIGNIYSYMGEWEQAIAYYKESIEHLERIGWLHEMGRAYNGLGAVYTKQENWSEAIINFEKCEEISNKIGDSHNRGWSLFNAAECYAKIGELDVAMEKCGLGEEILTRLDDRVGVALVYRNFGIIYHYKKDWKKGQEYFDKSIQLLEQFKVPFEFGSTYLEYGLMLQTKGDVSEAQKCFESSLKIYENMDAKAQVQRLEKILKIKKPNIGKEKNSK